MNWWALCVPLRRLFDVFDFCAAYFAILLGRCALLSLPVLGLVLLLRKTVGKRSVFAKGAVWAAFVPVPFLGKLSVYYQNRIFLPLLRWQSFCGGYRWVRWVYLLGAAVGIALLLRRRAKLRWLLRGLPSEEIGDQRIYLCEAPVSPFTAGILSPRIVLPKIARKQMDANDLQTILLHEWTHIRLGHLWIFLLWDILCALLWINPFLRLAAPKLKEDMEQICDAVTIRHSGRDAVSYGRVILKSLTLLRAEAVYLPATFAGERDFTDAKRRMSRVRDYRPYSRRAVAALCVCTAAALLGAMAAIHRASLPRYTDLTGFSIIHIAEDLTFSTVYETDADALPPVLPRGDSAVVDNAALRALLSEDVPEDGWYYIMWGGFQKMPGLGGAMNSVCVGALSDVAATITEFRDVNDRFCVKLVKWI